jgi:hypothetical protein
MRFEILELVKYDKTAAEILVDAVADNEVKFKLLNKVWNYIVTTTIVEKASQFKEVVADMYAFTGDDEVKLLIYDYSNVNEPECLFLQVHHNLILH